MGVNPEFFNNFWLVVGALVYGFILLVALSSAAWWRLRDQYDLNVLLFTILGVVYIWTLKADFTSSQFSFGLSLHLLGATLMTMMFGWAFAILAMSVVLITFTIMAAAPGSDNLLILPWNALLTCVLPVLLSYRLFRFADRCLPNNFFIYIFVCTFFGAALSMASVILASTCMHYLTGSFSVDYLSYNYLPYGLLLMFPEAFLTGMLMSIFVAYRPQWVSTFDDHRYLQNQ